MAEPLNVRVVSPEKLVYEGTAASVVAPAWDGSVGILPGHAPMITLLGAGELAIDVPGGGSESFFVAGGVLKIEGRELVVLSEFASAERPEEIPAGAVVSAEELLEAADAAD
jgi:F-type H+-transporting ATPase subunit epsilon